MLDHSVSLGPKSVIPKTISLNDHYKLRSRRYSYACGVAIAGDLLNPEIEGVLRILCFGGATVRIPSLRGFVEWAHTAVKLEVRKKRPWSYIITRRGGTLRRNPNPYTQGLGIYRLNHRPVYMFPFNLLETGRCPSKQRLCPT